MAGLMLVGLALYVLRGRIEGADVLQRIRDWGPWAPALYILIYIGACILLLPASPLTLAAGAVFGVVPGSIYVSIASTLGATAAFLVARFLGRSRVEQRIASWPVFRAIDDAVGREGWKIVLLTRLSPLFPFNVLNLAFGITRVRLVHFIAASWIGMLPATVLYVYLGSLAGTLLAPSRAKSPAEWTLFGVGLIATAAATILVTRWARRALEQRLPQPTPDTRSSGNDA